MKYHIVKSSRSYTGLPYCGPAIKSLGMDRAEAYGLRRTKVLIKKLNEINPVGWTYFKAKG